MWRRPLGRRIRVMPAAFELLQAAGAAAIIKHYAPDGALPPRRERENQSVARGSCGVTSDGEPSRDVVATTRDIVALKDATCITTAY